MFFATSKCMLESKIQNIGVSKTRDHIHIEIKMPTPSHEPLTSFKAPNEDLKDIGVLCTFIIKLESQNLIMNVSMTINHIHIKIKMPNPSQEPSASSKALNEDLNNMDVLCSSKSRKRGKIRTLNVSKTSDHIQSRSRCQTPFRDLQHHRKIQRRT